MPYKFRINLQILFLGCGRVPLNVSIFRTYTGISSWYGSAVKANFISKCFIWCLWSAAVAKSSCEEALSVVYDAVLYG